MTLDPLEADHGVTLGEVSRNLTRLETTVSGMHALLADLRSDVIREIDIRLSDRLALVNERVTRLERLTYGAASVTGIAFMSAVAALVYGHKGA